MTEHANTQERTLCAMYRDGASLRTLALAFDRSEEQVVEVLHRNGVVRREEGESWEDFVARIREDVKHSSAA